MRMRYRWKEEMDVEFEFRKRVHDFWYFVLHAMQDQARGNSLGNVMKIYSYAQEKTLTLQDEEEREDLLNQLEKCYEKVLKSLKTQK